MPDEHSPAGASETDSPHTDGSRVLADEYHADALAATVVDWHCGRGDTAAWLTIIVDCGAMRLSVPMSAAVARDLALEIVVNQAANLMYQPPNESMRESPKSAWADRPRGRRLRDGWKRRADACTNQVGE